MVLGYMNEMARFCEYAVEDARSLARCNSRELNHKPRESYTCPGSRLDTSFPSNWPVDPLLATPEGRRLTI